MIKKILLITSLISSLCLASCARQELDAPCPDYGKRCAKQPINSWDYY